MNYITNMYYFVVLLTWTCCRANIMPEFVPKENFLIISLPESPETPLGSVVHKFKGTDWDGDTLTFTITGDPSEVFQVERTSRTEANLVLKKELDRESISEFVLVATLKDGRTKKPATQSILIIVQDINDNYPQFDETRDKVYQFEENSEVPQLIGSFHATDPDEGPNGEVSYSLKFLDPTDESLFSVTTVDDDGQLQLVAPLDYETKTQHIIQLVALDNPVEDGVIPKETVINITINVMDISDTPPKFLPLNSSIPEISENVPIHTTVAQVRAVDGDKGFNSSMIYELLNEKDKFMVDKHGIIKTRFKLDVDHNSVGIYKLKIRATETGYRNGNPSDRIISKDNTSIATENEVTVNVTEVWGSPHFRNDTYVGQIPENSSPGTPVQIRTGYLTEVFDNDMGGRDFIQLSVDGDGDTFGVVPNKGYAHIAFQIVVKNPKRLDYERLKEMDILLIAEDSAGNTTKILVSVFITDENDIYPEFSQAQYLAKIPENPEHGLRVVEVQAFDQDSGVLGQEGLRFVSLRGLAEHELRLDEVTGEITVIGQKEPNSVSIFDREKNPEIYMTVEVRDEMGTGKGNTVTVVIQLQDENDNSPVFPQSFYEVEIYENLENISFSLRVSAVDLDEPSTNNSEIRYSVVDSKGSSSKNIGIDAVSGILFLESSFDFEKIYKTVPEYPLDKSLPVLQIPVNFTIRASDLGNPAQTTTVPLTVYVLDKNDCSPKFMQTLYEASVREDLKSYNDILKVTAIDDDVTTTYSSVIYSITEKYKKLFQIDTNSGTISLTPGYQLDWNVRNEHVFNVSCTDYLNLKCEEEAMVKITVMDVNDKQPILLGQTAVDVCEINRVYRLGNQTFFFNYVVDIPENSPATQEVIQLSAMDPDSNANLRYGIRYAGDTKYFKKGNIIPNFKLDLEKYLKIDESSGLITTGEMSFDYELMDSLAVEIVAEDIAGEINLPQTAFARMLIEVEDVIDLKPRFLLSKYNASIKENVALGTVVATVKAVSDEETDEAVFMKYSLEISETQNVAPFDIDKSQGVIWVSGNVDREKQDKYELIVKAAKLENLWTTVPVSIEVEDENDNAPVFTDTISQLSVDENIPAGSVIAQVNASDADSGEHGEVSYELDKFSAQNLFEIDPKSGVISVCGNIDREARDKYELIVKARDNFHSTTKLIQVTVNDVNDQKPEFYFVGSSITLESQSLHNLKFEIMETVPVGSSIFSFTLFDKDQPGSLNAQFTVTATCIQDEAIPVNLFKLKEQIDSKSNASWSVVTIRSLVGLEGKYTIVLEAEDKGTSPNKNMEPVIIEIKAVNPNHTSGAFKFAQESYMTTVMEGLMERTIVHQVAIKSDGVTLPNKAKLHFQLHDTLYSNLFSINPTTGLITTSFKLDNSKYKQIEYNFTVSMHWTNGHRQVNYSDSVNLTVRIVTKGQVSLLSSEMRYLASEARLIGYNLEKQLEKLLGLVVSVNPIKCESLETLCFHASLLCPTTRQALEQSEIFKVLSHSEPEVVKIFRKYKISYKRTEEEKVESGGVLRNALENLWVFIFTSQQEVAAEDKFVFQNCQMLYLYFVVVVGLILVVEMLVLLMLLALIYCCKKMKKRLCYCEADEIEYRHLVFNGYSDIPDEIKRLFVFKLDNSDGETEEAQETDC